MEDPPFLKDQFGVVWFTFGNGGLMSQSFYEKMRASHPELEMHPYAELPTCDAYDQSVVEIS